ncbi:MAG: hypothetical protein E5Y59_09605, partial [Mesorhizobium sp.]
MPPGADRSKHTGQSLRAVIACIGCKPIIEVGAAPHRPAGHFSPYSDGERGALIAGFANHQRCKNGVEAAPAPLPVTIRGEVPG